jgi:PAS domain S-box-containing protein
VAEQIFDTFGQSHAGVALIGPGGRFLRTNPALARMLGRSPAELEQLRWGDMLAGEPAGVDDAELTARRPDGSARRLRCRSRALDPETALAHFEDITAERETALLAAVVASVSDAVITTDREAQIVGLNGAAERMFGVASADVAGRSAVDAFVIPEDRAGAHEWARRLAQGEAHSSGVARLRRADGSVFDGEVVFFAVRDGGALLGMGGIVRDVSDRLAREAEAGVMRAVVNSAAEAIIGTDATGDVRFFSPSAERIYGYRADEVIGRPIAMLAADDRQAHVRTLDTALNLGGTVHRDTVARRKDGTQIGVHLIASPIVSAGGERLGAAITVLDVSDHRQAQHLLQRIIDHAPNVIAFKDLDGRCRLINTRGAFELYGREPEDVIGRDDHELFAAELADRLSAQDRDVIAAGAPMTFEDDVPQPDGRIRSYLTTKFPILGPDGRPSGVGLIAAEVTEIRQAQADRSQLAALVQAAPDAIVMKDRDGLIATWNPGAERMFGISAEAAIGCPYADTIIPPAERGRYAELRVAGRTLTLRETRMRSDGSLFPAQVSVASLGRDNGTLALVRDISDLVAAEEELAERAVQLERSNADLERFAYAASHDLQEPLRSMKMGAAMVLASAGARLDGDERGLVEHIEADATRLSAQVRGLMEVAQVALGDLHGEAAPLAVAVQDAVDALRAAAEAAGAVIDVQPLPGVEVPRAEMSLVMQNLIANAIKYHRRDVAPHVTVTGARSDGYLEVTVADNGAGLSKADNARIFGLFERAQPGVPGTGMGLAVARRMLVRHGGTIYADSAGPGRGSRFTVRLPA